MISVAPLSLKIKPEKRIWGINRIGATVMALSALVNSEDTNRPIAVEDTAVMKVVISSSRNGCISTPSFRQTNHHAEYAGNQNTLNQAENPKHNDFGGYIRA